ncbi:MAG: DUF4010 domain-containing protein [Planctomycetota bacterium]|nr:DUF4010 domain-containing protein [Planctomycetota bacterium]
MRPVAHKPLESQQLPDMVQNIPDLLQPLGLSLVLGLLVGLQREWAQSHVAGIRTFSLITLLGTASALLAKEFGGWVVAASFVGVIGAAAIGNLNDTKKDGRGAGVTTEIAMLVMFAVGAMLTVFPAQVSVALGGIVALLLHAKGWLHRLTASLGEKDVRAIMQFVLITCVILPVVPNQPIGPFSVLNPREVWYMVILVVGISLGGYALYRTVGAKAGLLLGGVIGGLISSTATTVSYARRASKDRSIAGSATVVIMLATCVMYARVLSEVAIVARDAFWSIAPPLLAMMALSVILASLMLMVVTRDAVKLPEQENPAELKSALFFAGMYALALLASAAAKNSAGPNAHYAVAALSGLANMDAITLSTARMVATNQMLPGEAWHAILIAAMANMGFKAIAVAFIGGRAMLGRASTLFALKIAAGVGVLLFWPQVA